MAPTPPPSMAPRPALEALPAELLEAIFVHLDPRSLVAASLTSRLIKRSAADSPVIWRHHCLTRFRFWAPRHDIAAKASAPLSSVDWHALFILRVNIAKTTRKLLDKILQSQLCRNQHISEAAELGYDAKETLLEECACPDDADDVLARRYYANAILERIQREMAIGIWTDVSRGIQVPIEKALGAFDLFTRTGEDADLDVITGHLDRLASTVLVDYPDFSELSVRQKALTLAAFLRDQGFRGVGDRLYRALRNSFIGLVLRSEQHESLPLVTAAIYCALASRLGLDARPCSFLFHVYCIVYAPKDYNLDGQYTPTSSSNLSSMYIDPFRSSEEVKKVDMRRNLHERGIPSREHELFFSHTTTREMGLRTGRNIMNSVQDIRNTAADNRIPDSWLTANPDMDSAFYASVWARLIIGQGEEPNITDVRGRQYLPYILDHLELHYPWDYTLIEKHVIPLMYNQPESRKIRKAAKAARDRDTLPKYVRSRDTPYTENVTYKVGTLFRHKRYNYQGVIVGWDPECKAGGDWMFTQGVDQLDNGRNQNFYHTLANDKSMRYVAEENIEYSPGPPSPEMLKLAGRHFKRWDADKQAFVSNVRDEYPDD